MWHEKLRWIYFFTCLIIASNAFGQDDYKAFASSPKQSALEQQVKDLQSKLVVADNDLASTKNALEQALKEVKDQKDAYDTLQRSNITKSTTRDFLEQPISIEGFARLQSTTILRNVVWKIIACKSCPSCGPFVQRLYERLRKWRIGPEEGNQFQIVYITSDEWTRRGYSLPRAELWVDGRFIGAAGDKGELEKISLDPDSLADEWNQRSTNNSENLAGMSVGTLPIKPQVEQLLRNLEPFLDGGTLTITYQPRTGTIKEYLTINQGKVAVRIPAKTTITLQMNKHELAAVFSSPTPLVHLPLRGDTAIKGALVSPAKFAIQLSYMVDPEWTITDPNSISSSDFDPDGDDEEVKPEDDQWLMGAPRSNHWPTVRAAFHRLHGKCAACGTTQNLNVHHIQPFHIDPSLELDPDNLIELCRDHHFHIGHDPDWEGPETPSWKKSNPNVVRDAKECYRRLHQNVSKTTQGI